MSGLCDWTEVFKAGKQTDSSGHTRVFTLKDLDHIVNSYDPSKNEAPAVIGHPRTNAPAYGWVEGLKREGDKLLAKFKQVMPEFEKIVQEGRYKKRSIALDENDSLLHVGFLGAVHPAVKGLKDITFSDEDNIRVYEYSDGENEMPEENIQLSNALEENKKLKEQLTSYAEAEEQKKTAEYASVEAENKRLKQEMAKIQIEQKRKEFEAFCDENAERILPRDKPRVTEFMMALSECGKRTFSDGQEKNLLTEFQDFLSAKAKELEFSEVTTKAKAATTTTKTKSSEFSSMKTDDERLEIHEKALTYAAQNKVGYEEAVTIVINQE